MYKRRELKIYKKSFYDLAKNVIRQWDIDGRPKGDERGIILWAELIQAHEKQMIGRVKQGSISHNDIKQRKK